MNYRKYTVYGMTILFIGSFFMSCASTEAPVEETVGKTQDITDSTVTDARNKADTARMAADDAKAAKAAAEEYQAADAAYQTGVDKQTASDLSGAVTAFEEAEAGFNQAALQADKNKQAALKAIAEAEEAISKTEQNAQNAMDEVEQEEQQ